MPEYCFGCKPDGMSDIKNKKCIECKNIRASYGPEGGRPDYCFGCKKEGMKDIVSKMCIVCSVKRPVFGIEGGIPEYCYGCKKEGMIDIKNKKCIECKNKRASYGPEGGTPEYCAGCKKEGMKDIVSKLCIECNETRPTFGIEGGIAEYCYGCKKEGMIDLKNKKCKSEWCNTRAEANRNNGYCLHCFIHLFPDSPVTRNYKTKETSVNCFIKEHYGSQLDIVSDRVIQGGCSRKRPDMLIDLGYQLIIIEVDENQHIDYDASCENRRIMELSKDVEFRPIVFVRFNPDEYTNGATKVTSCWALNGSGICSVKKSKKNEWAERLQKLKAAVDYWLVNKTSKTVEIVKLYYSS